MEIFTLITTSDRQFFKLNGDISTKELYDKFGNNIVDISSDYDYDSYEKSIINSNIDTYYQKEKNNLVVFGNGFSNISKYFINNFCCFVFNKYCIENKKLQINYDRLINQEANYTEKPNNTSFSIIKISDKNRIDFDSLNFIAHELLHLKQYNCGDLKNQHNKKYWRGVEIEYDSCAFENDYKKYRSYPWEIEAFNNSEYLLIEYISTIDKKCFESVELGIDFESILSEYDKKFTLKIIDTNVYGFDNIVFDFKHPIDRDKLKQDMM